MKIRHTKMIFIFIALGCTISVLKLSASGLWIVQDIENTTWDKSFVERPTIYGNRIAWLETPRMPPFVSMLKLR